MRRGGSRTALPSLAVPWPFAIEPWYVTEGGSRTAPTTGLTGQAKEDSAHRAEGGRREDGAADPEEEVAVALRLLTDVLPLRVGAECAPLRVVVRETIEADEIVERRLVRADLDRPEADGDDAMAAEYAHRVVVKALVDPGEEARIPAPVNPLLEDARRAVRVVELERVRRVGRRGEERGVDTGDQPGGAGVEVILILRHASLRRKSPDFSWRRLASSKAS